MLKKMPEFGLRPPAQTPRRLAVVIRLLCQKGDMDMAEGLMKDMGLMDLTACEVDAQERNST